MNSTAKPAPAASPQVTPAAWCADLAGPAWPEPSPSGPARPAPNFPGLPLPRLALPGPGLPGASAPGAGRDTDDGGQRERDPDHGQHAGPLAKQQARQYRESGRADGAQRANHAERRVAKPGVQ